MKRCFEVTHRLVLQLIAAGMIDGLRIDHAGRAVRPGRVCFAACRSASPQSPAGAAARALYLVVEKNQRLIRAPAAGLARCTGRPVITSPTSSNRMLVDFRHPAARMDRAYRAVIDEPLEWRDGGLRVPAAGAAPLARFRAETSPPTSWRGIARAPTGARATSLTNGLAAPAPRRKSSPVFPVYRTYVAANGLPTATGATSNGPSPPPGGAAPRTRRRCSISCVLRAAAGAAGADR